MSEPSAEILASWQKHVIGRIHSNDEMLFKLDGKPLEQSYRQYNEVGLSALANVQEALEIAGKKFEDVDHCLDLPCGYGRVLRTLQTRIQPNRITACDTNEEAVRFCSSEFGAEPLISNPDFRKIDFTKKYSLIWVGSLFTHIDKKSFSILLEVLYSTLESGGVLIFTTHGRYSLELIDKNVYGVQFPEKERLAHILKTQGYYYAAYEHSKEYGVSICSNEYVFAEVGRLLSENLGLLMYKYKGWSDHQDVYAYQRL